MSNYPQPGISMTSQSGEVLPAGWEMLSDSATGWPFFVDHNTQQTTWQDPRRKVTPQFGNFPTVSQPNYAQQSGRVREIPIMHESSKQPKQDYFSPPGRNSPARDIPIMRDHAGTHSSYSPGRSGTPDKSSIPQQRAVPRQINIQRDQPPVQTHAYWGGPSQPQQPPPPPPQPAPHPVQPNTGPAPAGWVAPPPQAQQYFRTECTQPVKETHHYSGTPIPIVREHQAPESPAQAPSAAQPSVPRFVNTPKGSHISRDSTDSATPPPQAKHLDPNAADQGVPKRGRSPSPMPGNLSPLQQVEYILEEAQLLQRQVNDFQGMKGDKDYMFLEEMMTRLLLKCDNIDSDGKQEIRSTRRQAVKTVQASLDQLELKAFANASPMPPTSKQSSEGADKDSGIGESSHVNEMVMDSEISC